MRNPYLLVLAATAGCSFTPSVELLPVEGQISVAGKPLMGGRVVFVPAASNAAAAQAIATGEDIAGIPADAALAPPGLGARLGLTVLLDGIADNASAATRFVRVGRPKCVPDRPLRSPHPPT